MPKLSSQPATFAALDKLGTETLLLFIHPDRRPLAGAAALVDWRLCGALSQALMDGGLTGKVGEQLMMPTHHRVGSTRLILRGAGPIGEKLSKAELEEALKAAHRAGAEDLGVQLPENIADDGALQALKAYPGQKICVVGPPPGLQNKLGS